MPTMNRADIFPTQQVESHAHTPVDLSRLVIESDSEGRIARHPDGFVIAVSPAYEDSPTQGNT